MVSTANEYRVSIALTVIPATGQRPTSRNPVNILKPLIYWNLAPPVKRSNPGLIAMEGGNAKRLSGTILALFPQE